MQVHAEVHTYMLRAYMHDPGDGMVGSEPEGGGGAHWGMSFKVEGLVEFEAIFETAECSFWGGLGGLLWFSEP
jgi:hypothetical protein